MKRKIFSKLLMGAFLIASVSMFVSCKDYDDDINKNSQDIAALQKELASLKSDLTGQLSSAQTEVATLKAQLESVKADLQSKIDGKADKSALDNKADKSDLDNKADKSALESTNAAVTALENQLTEAIARVATLETQIQAIDNCATKSDIEALQATLTAITGQIPSKDDIEAIAKAADVTLQTQIDALNAFQKKVEEAGYLTEADLTQIKSDIQGIKDQIAALTITEDVQKLTEAFQELSTKISTELTDGINAINMLVDKKLRSIVLRPNFYWEGIEGIEMPFISRTPVFEEKSNYKFQYQLTSKPAGEQLVDVWVEKYMTWAGQGENRELGKYVIATAPAHHSLLPDNNVDKVKRVDIAYGATAYYHLNPSIADIEGAHIGFYDHAAPVYTRGDANPSIAPKAKEDTYSKDGQYNKIKDGILEVPFEVNYAQVLAYFNSWVNTNKSITDPTWDNEKDEAGSETGHFSYGNYLPFVSLQIDIPENAEKGTEAYSINSDYAVVVPGFYTIVALADNNPEEDLDQETFLWEKPQTWTKPHEIRKNHLYETVGYGPNLSTITAKDANIDDKGFNEVERYGAIPMPATHKVLYNGEIDLLDFVETHFDYTTLTNYGKSFQDATLDTYENGQLMKNLGLHYDFTIINYTVGNEETSESAHILQFDSEKYPGNKSLFKPCSIVLDENQKWVKGEYTFPATREACDREPLIRVDLKDANDNIIRYGYIKLRIVDTISKDMEVTLNLNEMWMNCGDEGKVTWAQIENLILSKLGQEGFTKQEFENNYYLDVYGGYKNMPYIDPTKNTSANNDGDPAGPLYTSTWMAKRYKEAGSTVLAEEDVTKMTSTNNHFGEVWYTPHDNSTEGHNWDEQTNVLIWNLYPGVVSRDTKGTTVGKENAGNMDKAKYAALMNVLGVKYGNQGTSQKDLTTVIRFINKQTRKSIWVTLRVPEKMIHFEYGVIDNKDWSHWFKFNANNYEGSYGKLEGESATDYPYWSEFDTRINPFKPSNVNYLFLDAETTKPTSLVQKLSDHWMNPGEMVKLLGDRNKYSKFYNGTGTDPVIEFVFTVPEEVNDDKTAAGNSNNGSARTITLNVDPKWHSTKVWHNAWNVEGASWKDAALQKHTEWTLVLGKHGKEYAPGNDAIWAVGKNGYTYGPEEIAYLDGTFTASNGNVVNKVDLHYHGLEKPGTAYLYPAATDLINLSGAYDVEANARFEKSSGLTQLTQATFFEKNINEAFTAYIKINVTHSCYDPLIDKQFFNVRFHRPINVVGKAFNWNDRVLNDNTINIKDLVEMIDWNDFALVAYNSGSVSARNSMFGIDYPKYSDVFQDATHVKKQNLGLPYEYYGISELAIRYDEIRTDHAKQPGIRENAPEMFASAAYVLNSKNTDLVKDVPSLYSERQNVFDPNGVKYRTVTLLNADGTVVPFTVKHAFNHSIKNSQGSYEYGHLYYNNDASDVQRFHFYIPIAVKYNWGNIAWDDTLNDQPGVKLDNDYTQTVWAVITVTGTH